MAIGLAGLPAAFCLLVAYLWWSRRTYGGNSKTGNAKFALCHIQQYPCMSWSGVFYTRVCAERWFDRAWEACSSDPSMASEDEVFCSTYKHWVGYVDGQCAQHLHRCMPQHVRREMMKLKLGCSELNVHGLRFEGVAREKRWCPVCSRQHVHGCERQEVEDLVHFGLHCGSCGTIGANTAPFFCQRNVMVKMMHRCYSTCLSRATSWSSYIA